MLSESSVRRLMASVDQGTRVACCMASARLHDALVHPGVWPEVAIHKLDDHALDFVRRVLPRRLVLVSSVSDEIEEFLDKLVDGGGHLAVEEIHFDMAEAVFPRRCTVMETLARFPALRVLDIVCHRVRDPACLAIPGAMRGLHRLRIQDRGPMRKLEAYFFDADMPELTELTVRAAASDIMAHVPRFRELQSVSYSARDETYEDINLDQLSLARLELDVASATAFRNLMAELPRASLVHSLCLTLDGDATFNTYIPVRRLDVKLCGMFSTVSFVHAVLRYHVASLSICHVGAESWVAKFVGVGSWGNFSSWLGRAAVSLDAGGTVIVEP